jgi:hypothetical protein
MPESLLKKSSKKIYFAAFLNSPKKPQEKSDRLRRRRRLARRSSTHCCAMTVELCCVKVSGCAGFFIAELHTPLFKERLHFMNITGAIL